jgi:predicted nucleotidyltransferase component of viral defense system
VSKDALDLIRNSNFDRNALNRRADQTGSGRAAVEKDFVISAILLLISELPEFSKYSRKMAFRGGTCIKKVYFPDETRFSEDLDFTNLTIEKSNSFLEEVKPLIGRNLGVTTFERTEVEYQNERGLDFTLYYTSILQQRNHIAFNLSTATPVEEPKRMKVVVSPYFAASPKLPTMSLGEILAEKMRALLQRSRARDVFDIWYLIHEKGVKLEKDMLRKKLQRSYDAAPFGKKKDAETYIMNEIISRVKHSVTEKSWNNELGGLIMRPRPEREIVVESVCDILSKMKDISLRVPR